MRAWWLRLHGNKAFGASMAILRLAPAATVTPPAGQSNNVDPGSISTINRIHVDTSAGAASFSGLVAGLDGQLVWIFISGANDLTLLNESASSTITNRFHGLGDFVLPADSSVLIYYDSGIGAGTPGRWIMAV